MMEAMRKHISNMLSVSRMILAPLLIPLTTCLWGFIGLYLLIGISDVLDGYIARRNKAATHLGARLDSIADMIFYLILLWIFYYWYQPLIIESALLIAAIIGIRFLNVLLAGIKYKQVVFVHTIANKLSGIIVYLLPLLLFVSTNKRIVAISLLIALLAALEELAITLTRKVPNPNRRSIFTQ
jgi:phosphatidylglycerophosphate synthase